MLANRNVMTYSIFFATVARRRKKSPRKIKKQTQNWSWNSYLLMPQGRYFFNIIPFFEKYLPTGAPTLLKASLFSDTETLTHSVKKKNQPMLPW